MWLGVATEEASRPQGLQVEVHIGIDDGGRPAVSGDDVHVLLDALTLHAQGLTVNPLPIQCCRMKHYLSNEAFAAHAPS